MADDSTLMAYLIPRLTIQVENAATDALAYILNKSSGSMQALNNLLGEGGAAVRPIARVETQVTYEDGSRPDMAGYDANNMARLLVEVKFWAALLEDQAGAYAQKLEQSGPAVLLFIAPEIRMPTLWNEISRQLGKYNELGPARSAPGVQRAKMSGSKLEKKGVELELVLVGWLRLLDRLEASTADDGVRSDIRQLRGLAQAQDSQAFLPIHSEDLSPKLGHRLAWYNRLVDAVVDSRGVAQKWMDTQNLRATPQSYGYGRYFRFSGLEGDCWFGVNVRRWANEADTPLWLRHYDSSRAGIWTPIYPKLGAEYPEVLNDVAAQLMAIAEASPGFRRADSGMREEG